MTLIVWLGEPEATDPARTGGKASRLATLSRHRGGDCEVPDGFVVTTDAFDRVVAPLADVDRTAERIESRSLPEELERAIDDAMTRLGDAALAVRSSCTAEDLGSASFAGLYETVLDVRGASAVKDAVRFCLASTYADRVRAYRGASAAPRMAVLVQRLVRAEVAGVAFSADPVQGRRDVALVSATAGLGEALVSGASDAEEWEVGPEDRAPLRRRSRGLLDADRARRIAGLARRLAEAEGTPQDVEWALVGDTLHLLQARPITSLPEEVSWEVPSGGWIRNFRLGEWIGDPVTPLFQTWLLPRIESRLHHNIGALFGITNEALGRPLHVIVNGWYFYGLDFDFDAWQGLKIVARMLWAFVTKFRQVATLIPPIAHLGFRQELARWRRDILPPYQLAVAAARERVESAAPDELARMVDELGDHGGDQFTSILGVAGYAAKAELPIAQLWKKELGSLDATFLDVLGSDRAHTSCAHHVTGLDWAFPTLGELDAGEHAPDPEIRARAQERSRKALADARAALASRPRVLAKLEAALAEARLAHEARVEQTDALTIAWPILRRAALRLGDVLVARRLLSKAEDVFFVERGELDAALAGEAAPLHARVEERRSLWERRRRLAPPLVVGKLSGQFKAVFAMIDELLADPQADGAALRGMPGSPGRVTGRVRILRSMDELSRLEKGEILVSPVTTPGWTPAFSKAAAVITDTGSIASHASIVAREYGIPAVVATGNGTSTLHDGQLVTVDGGRGLVMLAA